MQWLRYQLMVYYKRFEGRQPSIHIVAFSCKYLKILLCESLPCMLFLKKTRFKSPMGGTDMNKLDLDLTVYYVTIAKNIQD